MLLTRREGSLSAPFALRLTGLGVFVLTLAVYGAGAFLFAYYARGNYDEGIFLYAGNLAYDGNVPFRDFPFTFGPLMPYVFGLPQALFGPSLLVGRMSAAFLSLVTAAAGGYVAYRFSGWQGALVCLALIGLNPVVLWIFTVPKTESVVAPLVMLALAVWILRPRDRLALIVAASLLLWAAAVRQTAIPASVGLAAIILYALRQHHRGLALGAGALGIQALLLFGVPALLSGENMYFGMVEAQLEYRQEDYALGERLQDVLSYYPSHLFSDFFAVLLPTAAVLALLAVRWRHGWRPDLRALDTDVSSAQALLILAALLVFGPHLSLRLPFTHYFAVSAALLAVLVGVSIGTVERPQWRALGAVLVSGLLVAAAIAFGMRQTDYLDTTTPFVQTQGDITAYLEDELGDDERLVTFHPSYGLISGRPLPAELTMGVISYWPSMKTERAERLHVVNREVFDRFLSDPRTRVAILDDFSVNLWVLEGAGAGPLRTDLSVNDRYLEALPVLEEQGYHLDESFEAIAPPGVHAFVR